MDLNGNNINDEIVIAFTGALAGNKTLKLIALEYCTDEEDASDNEDDNEITDRGWEAASTLVCNKTSIIDTYSSNHVLHKLGDHNEMNLPEDLFSYLKLKQCVLFHLKKI